MHSTATLPIGETQSGHAPLCASPFVSDWQSERGVNYIIINKALEDSRLSPHAQRIVRLHSQLHCVRRGLRPRDVSQREATQWGCAAEARKLRLSVLPPADWHPSAVSLSYIYIMPYCVKTWRQSQNRKYITYCIAARGEPSHGHVQKISWSLGMWFLRYMLASRQRYRHAELIRLNFNLSWNTEIEKLNSVRYCYYCYRPQHLEAWIPKFFCLAVTYLRNSGRTIKTQWDVLHSINCASGNACITCTTINELSHALRSRLHHVHGNTYRLARSNREEKRRTVYENRSDSEKNCASDVSQLMVIMVFG